MGFGLTYYFAAFAVILITRSAIFPVNGQCTVHGGDNGDPLISISAEIQQLKVELFGKLDEQVKSIQAVERRILEHDVVLKFLNESFQEMKSLQAVERRLLEQDVVLKFLNESFQEMKSLQAVDRRSQENDICIKQVRSVHELLNESFQEMRSLQAVDRRSQENDICIKQVRRVHELLNESFQEMKSLQAVDRRSQENDICIKQVRSVHELLNETFQEMKSLQAVDRGSQENDICIKQVRSVHELLNESFQEMKSQFGAVNLSLQAVDRCLLNCRIDSKNQTQQSLDLANGTSDRVTHVRDCSDIKASGHNRSGVYEVCVGDQPNRVCSNAFCNMEATNRASLVFQRRKDGSVLFNRTWVEYRDGFGNPDGEFWLGNEMLSLLTLKRRYKLRVDLEDWEGEKRYAEYSTFSINSSDTNYTLTIGGYSGNAGDSMSYQIGRQFTTIDADNDEYPGNCAGLSGGAWWHGGCSLALLNGKYYQRYDPVIYGTGIHWYYWRDGSSYSLKAAEMKLVPVA